MRIEWSDDATIEVTVDGGGSVISANRAGLQSLARILTSLADEPVGSHVHLDEYNALDDGSTELIIERKA